MKLDRSLWSFVERATACAEGNADAGRTDEDAEQLMRLYPNTLAHQLLAMTEVASASPMAGRPAGPAGDADDARHQDGMCTDDREEGLALGQGEPVQTACVNADGARGVR